MDLPTVTLALQTYKQEAFVREAVRGALAQDYSPLEIFISDDCSPDATFDIIKDEADRYGGPHSVVLNRNAERIGPLHRRSVVGRFRGTYIVQASGDDVSYPNRVSRLIATALRTGASLVSSNAHAIDETGRRIGLTAAGEESRQIPIEELAGKGWRPELLGATFALHRRLYDAFPLSPPDQTYQMQDHFMPFRAMLLDMVWYESEPLMAYRYHPDSMSNRQADRTGDPAIYRETLFAHELGSPILMLAELTQFLKGRPTDRRLRHVRRLLEGRVIDQAYALVVQRNRLRMAGYVPTWIRREELQARPVRPELTMRPAVRDPG